MEDNQKLEQELHEAEHATDDLLEESAKKEDLSKLRWGTNRWFILLFIILGFIGARFYPPILPHIQLPAEKYPGGPLFSLPVIGDLYWTNTLTAMVVADVLIILIAILVRRAIKSGALIAGGMAGAIEALLEVIYNLTESTAGKWARTIFPWFASITLSIDS